MKICCIEDVVSSKIFLRREYMNLLSESEINGQKIYYAIIKDINHMPLINQVCFMDHINSIENVENTYNMIRIPKRIVNNYYMISSNNYKCLEINPKKDYDIEPFIVTNNNIINKIIFNVYLTTTYDMNIVIDAAELIDIIKKYLSQSYFIKNRVYFIKYTPKNLNKTITLNIVPITINDNDTEGVIDIEKTEILLEKDSLYTYINYINEKNYMNYRGDSVLKGLIPPNEITYKNIGIGGASHILREIYNQLLLPRGVGMPNLKNLKQKGCILYGQPGTGKSLIASKISKLASFTNEPKIISGPEVLNKYVGQSESNIRDIFAEAESNPDGFFLIIIDEIDSLLKKRGSSSGGTGIDDKVVNQFLSKIDGIKKNDNYIVIGTTNRLDLLDDAILRSGRLGLKIEVGIPDTEGRKEMIELQLQPYIENNIIKNPNIDQFAFMTSGFTGAMISEAFSRVQNMLCNNIIEELNNDNSIDFTKIKMNNIVLTDEMIAKAISECIPPGGNYFTISSNISKNGFVKNISIADNAINQTINNLELKKNGVKITLIHGGIGTGKSTIALETANKYQHDKSIDHVSYINCVEYIINAQMFQTLLDDKISEEYNRKKGIIIIDNFQFLEGATSIIAKILYNIEEKNINVKKQYDYNINFILVMPSEYFSKIKSEKLFEKLAGYKGKQIIENSAEVKKITESYDANRIIPNYTNKDLTSGISICDLYNEKNMIFITNNNIIMDDDVDDLYL